MSVRIAQKSPILVIFSDIDGLYDCDPRLHTDAKLIERIEHIDDNVYALAGGAGSRVSIFTSVQLMIC